jgi:Zn-dependent M28 family amino/carboxypeptidase
MLVRIAILVLLTLPNIATAQSVVDLRKHVEYLTSEDLQGRRAGSEECNKAAEYIYQQLKSFGYTPEYQEFSIRGGKTKNVLAVRTGGLDSVIVVGAHYDAMGPMRGSFCPGADDNGSGTAAVLELARMLKASRRTVLFIFFSGEEEGLVGSAYYIKHPKFDDTKTIFMLNLDMVGYLKESTQARAPDVNKLLQVLYTKHPFASGIVILGGTASDQESFSDIGTPVAFLHTGLHSAYHTPRDTSDKLNYAGMEKIVLFSYDLIKALDTHDLPSYNIMGKRNGRY